MILPLLRADPSAGWRHTDGRGRQEHSGVFDITLAEGAPRRDYVSRIRIDGVIKTLPTHHGAWLLSRISGCCNPALNQTAREAGGALWAIGEK